jgi:hypothetical protein
MFDFLEFTKPDGGKIWLDTKTIMFVETPSITGDVYDKRTKCVIMCAVGSTKRLVEVVEPYEEVKELTTKLLEI